ncbi:Uncharacterised protein at_DN0319 [Pycnogonum litorale]
MTRRIFANFLKLSAVTSFCIVTSYCILKRQVENVVMRSDSSRLTAFGRFNDVNWNHFEFITSSAICNNVQPSVIVFVVSHPSHKEARRILRHVYNRSISGHIMRVVFVHGWTKNQTLQSSIEQESKQYGDIIQGNFEDSYKSVSYLHLTGLKWTTSYCSKAKFILKADDDIYIDVKTLSENLKTDSKQNGDFIYCDPIYKARVQRDPNDRYYVSENQYPNQTYPTYCNGWAVLYPYKVAEQIVRHSDRVPFMWMSDVFTTGIIRSEIKGIDVLKMEPGYTWDVNTLKSWLKNGMEHEKHIVGPVWGDNQLLIKLHQKSKTLPANFELS